jgi:hypothetical protein
MRQRNRHLPLATRRLALAGWTVTVVVGGLGLPYLVAGLLGRF